MICNNVGIKVKMVLQYHICMVHGITQWTFFLNRLARLRLQMAAHNTCCTCRNFMLMRKYYILPRYKADQYQP